MRKHLLSLSILLLVSLFCMKALFHPGLFTAHDIWHQVARLYWYNESVKSGAFPPHWIAPMANGFGYPLFVFSYHFPWIIGIVFLFLGASVTTTIKILFIVSFLFSGWGMYWLSFLFTKNRFASFVSGTLYLVAPWRFVTILVSAAMGKSFVFTLFPFIAISLYYMAKSKRKRLPVFALSLTLSSLILTHLISILTLGAIIIPLFFILKPSSKWVAAAGFLTLILTAWYIVPLLRLGSVIQASMGQFKSLYLSQFVNFKQLIYSPWGYGIVLYSAKEGAFSYQLGFAQWAAIVMSLFLFIRSTQRKLIGLLLLSFCICIFLMLEISIPFWQVVSRFITIDYPTMFLMPAVFIAAFLSAIVINHAKKTSFLVGGVLVSLAIVNNRNYLRVNEYVNPAVSDVIVSEITTNSFNEYLPLSANVTVMSLNTTPEIQGISVYDISVNRTPSRYTALFESRERGDVILKVFAFPDIMVTVDGKETKYSVTKTGQIEFFVEAGKHHVVVFYQPNLLE